MTRLKRWATVVEGAERSTQSPPVFQGEYWLCSFSSCKGRVPLPNRMNFWKSSRGAGSFSIQKFMLQILETLNRTFLSWIWYQIVISEFQGFMFFSTIVLRKIKTRHTLKKACACISYYLALIPPCKYATISIKKFATYFFQKWGLGIKGRLEFFQKFICFGRGTLP